MWTFVTRSIILLVLVQNITSLSFVQEHSRGFEFPSDPARNTYDGIYKNESKNRDLNSNTSSFFKGLARQSLVSGSFGGTPSLTSGLTGQFPAGVGFASPNPMPQTALIVNNSTVGACICVTTGSCALAGGVTSPGGSSDGAGLIDVRIISVSIINSTNDLWCPKWSTNKLCQCYHLINLIFRKNCNVLKSKNTGYSKLS